MKIERTGTADAPRYLKMLVCGDPGKGKTLMSSTAPNPLFLSAEGGTMSIDDRHVPFTKIDSSAEFFTLLKILQAEPMDRARRLKKLGLDAAIDTVVVDTIDEISQILAKERYTAAKRDSLDLQGYGWLKEQMKSIVTALRNLDLHVIMTCHLRSRADDEGKNSILPAIEGGFAEKIAGYVDLALLLRSATTTEIIDNQPTKVVHRWLQTYADPLHEWVKDRSGKLAFEVKVNFDDDFTRMAATIWPGRGPTVSTVTPEEVEAYRQKVLADQQEALEAPEPDPLVPDLFSEPDDAPDGLTIGVTEAKKQVFAAADNDIEKASGAWKTAGLDKRLDVTTEELDEAIRLASLPISV